jgi:hypothetical protein
MAAVHNATMTFARRLAHVELVVQQDRRRSNKGRRDEGQSCSADGKTAG